ncbi:hypothetical protein EAE96_006682 [Botrytis aclada]|nr:hypothetical protein EAE96_006682 [Botrytis aclada]
MDLSPTESSPGDLNHLHSGDAMEVDNSEEEQGRSPHTKEQHGVKRGRDDETEGRMRHDNIADVHALQHKNGSSVSASNPTAKRRRDDDQDDMTPQREQNNAVDQKESKRRCDGSSKDRRVLSGAFFRLVRRGGGRIQYDFWADPWGLIKKDGVPKRSWEMSPKQFDDEMSMLDAAMVGFTLK